jgi:hypothetical protein
MALVRRGLVGLVPRLLAQSEAAICNSGLQGVGAPSLRDEETSSSGSKWMPFRGALRTLRGWQIAVSRP